MTTPFTADALEGRTAVVTGAASGIGLALCERLLAEGMQVVLADVEADRLDEAADGLGAPDRVLAVTTDVTDAAAVELLRDRTEERFGPAYLVCNNAGVEAPAEYALDIPMRYWQWIVNVNLWGVVHGCLSFLPGMLVRGEGHVVNTSSLSGLLAVPFHVPYSMAKHGIVGLSMGLQAEQVARGSAVQVHVLCPPLVRTRLLESDRNLPGASEGPKMAGLSADGAHVDRWEREMMQQSVGPEEMARLVVESVQTGRFWALPDWPMPLPRGGTLQDYIKDTWTSAVDDRTLDILDLRG